MVQVEVDRVLAEIRVAGILDTHTHIEEVEVVEVHRHDFLLGVVTLQLHSDEPLDGLLHHAGTIRACHIRIELLCQLLCDGGTTTGTFLTHHQSLHHSTSDGLHVNA